MPMMMVGMPIVRAINDGGFVVSTAAVHHGYRGEALHGQSDDQ
jgi:hypothetical protein